MRWGDEYSDTFNILQGAACVQGQNLMAKSMKKNQNYEYAKLLLYSPSVVEIILNSLQNAKLKKSRSVDTINFLIEGMQTYKKMTAPKILGEGEVEKVIKGTNQFLKTYKNS